MAANISWNAGEQHERHGRRVGLGRLEADVVEEREVETADQAEPADVRPEREA